MRVRFMQRVAGPDIGPYRAGHVADLADDRAEQLIRAGAAAEVSEHAEACEEFDERTRERVLREAAEVEESNRIQAHRAKGA